VSNLYPNAKLLWSLAASGIGTTISAAGNSGSWAGSGAGDILPPTDFRTAVDLRDICDVALMVSAGGVTSSPVMTVGLDLLDDLGNLYADALQSETITGAGTAILSGGLHGYSSGTYLVLPAWGRVNWSAVSGGTFTGVAISLWGR
jgi:hypothetical protein